MVRRLVEDDRAVIDAVAERTLAIEDRTINGYDGGWAEYVRRREELADPPPPREAKPKKERPRPAPAQAKPRPTELEQLEAAIARREESLAELERKLAEDWANVETLQAHRRARDELDSMLGRWEELFEKSQAR